MGYAARITAKGQELLAKAIMGDALAFTKMVLSDQLNESGDLVLGNERLTANITDATKESNWIKLETSFINTDVPAGFQIKEIGIFVNEPADGQVLFAICSTDVPDYMPAHSEHPLEETFRIYLEVGSAELTMTIDSSVFATKQEVQQLVTQTQDGRMHKEDKVKLDNLETWVAGLYALRTHNHDLVYSPYVHNHDTAYLGKTAKAADSGKLNGQPATYYATAGHGHGGTYEPVIATKNSGFNLDKSDSVTSTSTSVLATSKAAKTAYDKGVEALNKANSAQATANSKANVTVSATAPLNPNAGDIWIDPDV